MICTVVSIWCDECNDCIESGTVEQGYGVREMRNRAKEQGWTHTHGRDLCERCSKELNKRIQKLLKGEH